MSLTGYQLGGALNTINQAQSNMPFPVAAAIGALGSIGSSLIGNRGRKRSERRARDFNLQMWHKQNRYNHPIEQMARLKQAGLNPNMIYGSSPGSAVGNAGQVPAGQAEDYQFANPAVPAFNAQLQSAQSLETLERAGLNKVNKEIKQKTANSIIEIEKYKADQEKEKAFQAQLNTSILSASQKDQIETFKANLELLRWQGRKAEAQVEVEKLNAWIARTAKMRPNDPFWIRSLFTLGSLITMPENPLQNVPQDPNWDYKQDSKGQYMIDKRTGEKVYY